MNLYLVRHGEAVSKEQDPERPLSGAGAETARRVAAALRGSEVISATRVHHSTKARARQTAEILAEGLGLGTPVTEVPNLEPLDDVSELVQTLEQAETDLMLVGHLPHLDRLASRLVAGDAGAGAFDFAACGVLCLGRKEGAEGSTPWVVRWMLDPALLTA